MSKVFVGGLADTVSTEQLREYFDDYGTISDAVAVKQRGFGFVEFEEDWAAQSVIDAAPHTLHDKETAVKVAQTREQRLAEGPSQRPERPRAASSNSGPPPSMPNKLFVGGLGQHLGTEAVRNYFSAFGSVSDAVVMPMKGFGFVAFHDRQVMESMLVQDHWLEGQQLNLREADGVQRPRHGGKGGCAGGKGGGGGVGGPARAGSGPYGKGPVFSPSGVVKKVFVGGIPRDMDVSEMREFFGYYGAITDAIVMAERGFGFVEFRDQASVDRVLADAGTVVIRAHKITLRFADGKKGANLVGQKDNLLTPSPGARPPAPAGAIAVSPWQSPFGTGGSAAPWGGAPGAGGGAAPWGAAPWGAAGMAALGDGGWH
mmetsp:Transcript_11573/g.37018  ORF Transcript_11573/g.37018 Transcript_11573/m.37018 type:complete len:372 (+) Transcript_11573:112-1227(+)